MNDPYEPELIRKLLGHNDTIMSLSFNSSTEQLLSCSNDSHLYLWNLKNKSAKPLKLKGHSAAISEVAFAPSGSYMVSASLDHTVRIWTNSMSEKYPSVA